MAGHEERRKTVKPTEKKKHTAHVSASDVSREDFDKGRHRRGERSAELKKSYGFFLRHGMLLRENIRR